MTIECPRCGTLYRRPAHAARAAVPTYRCARCRHVFSEADEPAIVSRGRDALRDDEPRFTLAADAEDALADDEVPEAVEVRGPSRRAPQRGGVARFAMRAMLLVTLAYAVLSVYVYTHPETAREALRALPLVGARLVEVHVDPTAVQLTNVRGEYERVQGDRLVFVVSGTAVNTSGLPVRGIQIEGRIVGGQEQRQVVFCGAAPRDVHDLSLREIALLQTLEPPKEWSLGAGQRTGFLVVFPAPPADLREFGAEVVAVKAPARRAGDA